MSVLSKIIKDVFTKRQSAVFGEFNIAGSSEHEFEHEICVSTEPDYAGLYFVRCRFIQYHNQSVQDFGTRLHIYDINGEFSKTVEVDNDSRFILNSLKPLK